MELNHVNVGAITQDLESLSIIYNHGDKQKRKRKREKQNNLAQNHRTKNKLKKQHTRRPLGPTTVTTTRVERVNWLNRVN